MKRAHRRLPPALRVPVIALGLAFTSLHANAHHSLASYDDSQVIEIDGTLRHTKIANPHTWFWVVVPPTDAHSDAAATQWAIETAGSGFILRSIGGVLRDQFAPEQKVHVTFHPARNGGRTGLLAQMRFDDGRVLNGVPLK